MTRALPLLGLCTLAFAACKREGPTPAYLLLNQPVVVGANGQGISAKITDAWVYVNDEPAGVWEPGKRIPLIAEGSSTVRIIAGVRKNGITDERIQYPYYANWQQTLSLVPAQTLSVQPQFHYFNNLTYWLADFDTGHRFDTLECTAVMELVPSDSTLTGQGVGNGRITLDTAHALYRGVSSGDPFTFISPSAFLELDYRGDTPLLVGIRYSVQGDYTNRPYVYVAPTVQPDGSMPWTKLYVDLGTVWQVSGAMDKRFYIEAGLQAGATSGIVEVDNIKLVQP